MTSKRVLSVAESGLSDHEHQVLKSILWLSRIRPISYSLSRLSPRNLTDIVIINGDDADALAKWTSYRKSNPATPVIMVKNEQPYDDKAYYIRRPLVALRVLNLLDAIAGKEGLISASERAAGQSLPAAVTIPDAAARPATALVVEDSLVARKQIARELKALGIEISFAESAELAFECLARNTYSIVFLDVILPDGDGLKICKAIKQDPKNRQTPVIMFTSKSSPLDRLKGRMAGCDAYLIKPVQSATLQKAIKQYLLQDGETPTVENARAI